MDSNTWVELITAILGLIKLLLEIEKLVAERKNKRKAHQKRQSPRKHKR